MEPSTLIWAKVPLRSQGNKLIAHPAVVFREIDTGVLIFGGTSTRQDVIQELCVIDFTQRYYKRLSYWDMDKVTYFYWKFFQHITRDQIVSETNWQAHPDDYDRLLTSAGL